jgi:hypothetical protein
MTPEFIVAIIIFGVLLLAVIGIVNRRRPKTLNQSYFNDRWKAAIKQLGSSDTWALAVIDADKLLDEALRKTRVAGKTMGERMVSAQRKFTDNDAVWFAHKLRNRLVHETNVKLKEADVKEALQGFRQGLKDLGALK